MSAALEKFMLSIGIVDGQDFNLGSHAGSVRIHRHS